MIKRVGLPFYQWEIDRQISITDVDYDEINWYNKNMEKAIVTEPSSIVLVPNILLQEAENIYIFLLKDSHVVCNISFGVRQRKQPEDYIYTETELLTYKSLEELINSKIGGYTWCIDTDIITDKNGKEHGALADVMTNAYSGTWFYIISSTSDAGTSPYPAEYSIDGANGYLNLREYVIWTGSKLVRVPVFESKPSTEIDEETGKYKWQSGVDGLYSSTEAAYSKDIRERFISACQKNAKNSGYDCSESGLYGNITGGRAEAVNGNNVPVGNLMAIHDKATGVTSQLMLGQSIERDGSLHTDMWFRGNSESTEWLRALTSDNFFRFINMNYTDVANWATVPGIYKMAPNDKDTYRAFVEEHIMFTIPGAPEPDADYLAIAKSEGRTKMRAHAITQLAINDNGAMKVRYCSIPNTNKSVTYKCTEWFDLLPEHTTDLKDSSVVSAKIADGAIDESKLDSGLLAKINTAYQAALAGNTTE